MRSTGADQPARVVDDTGSRTDPSKLRYAGSLLWGAGASAATGVSTFRTGVFRGADTRVCRAETRLALGRADCCENLSPFPALSNHAELPPPPSASVPAGEMALPYLASARQFSLTPCTASRPYEQRQGLVGWIAASSRADVPVFAPGANRRRHRRFLAAGWSGSRHTSRTIQCSGLGYRPEDYACPRPGVQADAETSLCAADRCLRHGDGCRNVETPGRRFTCNRAIQRMRPPLNTMSARIPQPTCHISATGVFRQMTGKNGLMSVTRQILSVSLLHVDKLSARCL